MVMVMNTQLYRPQQILQQLTHLLKQLPYNLQWWCCEIVIFLKNLFHMLAQIINNLLQRLWQGWYLTPIISQGFMAGLHIHRWQKLLVHNLVIKNWVWVITSSRFQIFVISNYYDFQLKCREGITCIQIAMSRTLYLFISLPLETGRASRSNLL